MLLILLAVSLGCCFYYPVWGDENGDLKIWIPDTNFNNLKNWENGHLPCANDRVILQNKVISFMTSAIAVSELVLPVDGQLIFKDDASITLTGGKAAVACSGEDAKFKVALDSWFDSTNWNMSSPRAYPIELSGSGRNPAVPHAHQVPCTTDHVVFRSQTAFKVHVEIPTAVASISINNKKFGTQDFANLLSSQTGSLLFPDNPRISVTGSSCNDISGCSCGNDEPQIMSKICSHHPICPPIECSDPVQPIGHCCQICGAYFVMEYHRVFEIEKLLLLHNSYLQKTEFQSVFSYTGKTYQDQIQTVFVDGGREKGSASEIAGQIHHLLTQDIKGARLYNLRSIQMHRSMDWGTGVPTHQPYGTGQGISSGGVVGIILTIIIISGCLLAAFYIYKRRYPSGYSFARFDLHSEKVMLELGTTPHEDLQPGESAASGRDNETSDKAFDNPVFGTEAEKALPDMDSINEDPTYLENPMFRVLDEAEKAEKNEL